MNSSGLFSYFITYELDLKLSTVPRHPGLELTERLKDKTFTDIEGAKLTSLKLERHNAK